MSAKTNDITELVRQLRDIGFPTGIEAADALEEMQRQRDALAEALRELVECRSLKYRIPLTHTMERQRLHDEYIHRNPLAWQVAIAALALLKDSPTREGEPDLHAIGVTAISAAKVSHD